LWAFQVNIQVGPLFMTEQELKKRRLVKAIQNAAGSWKDKDHPELKQGAAKWVERMRRQDEKRVARLKSR
jgi:hypothetical protein